MVDFYNDFAKESYLEALKIGDTKLVTVSSTFNIHADLDDFRFRQPKLTEQHMRYLIN